MTVVGVGGDGWDGLSARAREHLKHARVVLGSPRHLAMLPTIPGQQHMRWPSPLREGLPSLLESVGDSPVVALASGDPLVSGIASTLLELLGEEQVTVLPALSSVALARAAMRWPAEQHGVISVVGRDVSLVRRELAPRRRLLVLSSDEHTPRRVAQLLVDVGYGDSAVTVLGDLSSPAEFSAWFDQARAIATGDFAFPRLNIVAVECTGPALGGWVAGLPDDVFEHDGALTKRDLRACALARLAPVPGEHLWDVGAGAGSIGIEWMRAHPSCTATAIEADPSRADRIARNAASLGVPGLRIVHGLAPGALSGLAAPDAIFVGGGATRPGVIETCLAALRSGGRLVVHAVTLETEHLLASLYRDNGGELTRISVQTAAPMGSFTGWDPARAVTQWTLRR